MNKKIIPNIVTIINMICGLCAIISAVHIHFVSCIFVLISCFLDFIDGFLARKLNAQSKIGAQLDSLADIISFGVAPTIIIYYFLLNINTNYAVCFISFTITIAAAVRLARFNSERKKYFVGLPTPAAAIFICSISLIDVKDINITKYYTLASIIIISYLMISKIEMFKIEKNNLSKVFLIISLIIIIFYKIQGLSIAVFLYIAMSIIKNKYGISSKN